MKKLSIFFLLLLFAYVNVNAANTPDQICALYQKKIQLVWLTDPEKSWEDDWIRELLSDVRYEITEVLDLQWEHSFDNAIYVTSIPHKEKYRDYFTRLHQKGYKFGVIHLSDELYHHPIDFYPYAKFVLRNYWNKDYLTNRKILAFPLGYKRKFWDNYPSKEVKEASQRRFNWSFAGQINKSTRYSMIDNMKKTRGYHIHQIFDWNAQNSLGATEYRDLLLESIFVPCPRGWWNLDSFRVCEALECGCIPIVEKTPFDYFARLFMDFPYLAKYPFIAINSWDEVPQIMDDLMADPERLEQLRSECHTWWLNYKKKLRTKIANIVDKSLK